MRGPVRVRPFASSEWATLRALRLRALADAPDAFARTRAEEEAIPESEWQRRLAETVDADWQISVLALCDEEPVGLAYGRLEEPGSEKANLYSMWVAPEARRTGAGRALVAGVIDWARAAGARRLLLEVTESNTAALALYRSLGFRGTGVRRPLREGSPLAVKGLALDLSAPSGSIR
jgi:ribosomal protein S18 acetylase RimI-like enzyme